MDKLGSAFPWQWTDEKGSTIINKGLSRRDWFAGLALQGELSAQKHGSPEDWGHIYVTEDCYKMLASKAYAIADAMIKESQK